MPLDDRSLGVAEVLCAKPMSDKNYLITDYHVVLSEVKCKMKLTELESD